MTTTTPLTWIDGKDTATMSIGGDYQLTLSQHGKVFKVKLLDLQTTGVLFENAQVTADVMEDAKREAMFLASNALGDQVKRAGRAEKRLIDSAV